MKISAILIIIGIVILYLFLKQFDTPCPEDQPRCWSDKRQEEFIRTHDLEFGPDGFTATPKR